MRTIAANMGFTLQLAGAFLLPAIGAGLYLGETVPVISLFCSATAFFLLGFLLNSLAEKRRLDVGQAALLVSLTFLILSAIGALPYFLSVFREGGLIERIANSFFEAVSGYTTTGFSFIPDESVLPVSMQIYRVTTEFVGGVGLVFLLLAFFHSDSSLRGLESALGTEEIGTFSPRKKYFEIFAVYAIYIAALSGALFFLGYGKILPNVIHIIHLITGGYSSAPALLPGYLSGAGLLVAIATMFIGAISFVFHHRLLTGKILKVFSLEIFVFLLIVGAGTFALAGSSGGALGGLFQALSFSSGTGLSLVPLGGYGEGGKLALIVLMFIGGCGFSMAGGLKVSRLLSAMRGVSETVVRYVKGPVTSERETLESAEGRARTAENMSSLVSISLGSAVVLGTGVLLMGAFGTPLLDSVFEAVSAYSTTGASIGIVSVSNPIWAKLMFAALMLLGRIDLIVFLISFGYFAYSLSSGDLLGKNYVVEIETEEAAVPSADESSEDSPKKRGKTKG